MERQELLTKGAKAFISDDEDEEEGADASAQSKTHKRSEKVDRMRCERKRKSIPVLNVEQRSLLV